MVPAGSLLKSYFRSLAWVNGSTGEMVSNIVSCGDDDFLMVYGSQVLSKQAKKSIMKFNKNLQPVWTAPIIISGAGVGVIDIYSYTNPKDKITISYLFGAEQFLQALSDGATKAKKTDIPAKELENIAAVYTDINGLNIITLIGDKKFPTGNMNWYVFSHDQLAMTKKNIVLPLPSGIDKNNVSGWRLNQVTSSGLYFSYVSYKNKVKESGSILSCNIIKVNNQGNPDNIVTMDLNCDKYTMMPASYTQNLFLTATPSRLFNGTWQHNSNCRVFLPAPIDFYGAFGTYNDNSYMGIQVDEDNNRIYTVIAVSDELKVGSDGYPGLANAMVGKAYPIKSFEATVFDLTGKKINKSIVDHKLAPLVASDNWDYCANIISLNLLDNNEGVICKAINNGNGYIFSLNKDGKIEKQSKFELFSYKEMTALYYKDTYPAFYSTMKDFENSPYILNIKSPEVQYFNKIDKIAKPTALYLSLKNGDLFADWDSKNDLVKLKYFTK